MPRGDATGFRRSCDIAYACYAFAGLVPLLVAVVSLVPMDTGTAGGVGLLVLVPVTLAAFAAVVVGLRYTIRVWRHWPLIFCGVFSALYVVVFLMEFGPEWLRSILPVVYGLTMLGLAFRWFLFLRRSPVAP